MAVIWQVAVINELAIDCVNVSVLPLSVPLPLVVYVAPQLSLKVCDGMVSVLPLAVRVKLTALKQLPEPTSPGLANVEPLLPAFKTSDTAPPQVEVPVQVPTNFAASFPPLLFLLHDEYTTIENAARQTQANKISFWFLRVIKFSVDLFKCINNYY